MSLFPVHIAIPVSFDALTLHYFEMFYRDSSFIWMQQSLYIGIAYH